MAYHVMGDGTTDVVVVRGIVRHGPSIERAMDDNRAVMDAADSKRAVISGDGPNSGPTFIRRIR